MKPPPRSASMNVFSALMLFQITVVASEYYWNCEPDYNSCILNQTITTNTKWPNSDPKAMSECNQNCFGGYYRCSNITGECVKTNADVNQTGLSKDRCDFNCYCDITLNPNCSKFGWYCNSSYDQPGCYRYNDPSKRVTDRDTCDVLCQTSLLCIYDCGDYIWQHCVHQMDPSKAETLKCPGQHHDMSTGLSVGDCQPDNAACFTDAMCCHKKCLKDGQRGGTCIGPPPPFEPFTCPFPSNRTGVLLTNAADNQYKYQTCYENYACRGFGNVYGQPCKGDSPPCKAAHALGKSFCPCGPGSYGLGGQSGSGEICTPCSTGKFSTEGVATTADTCEMCPNGTYNSQEGVSHCQSCLGGYYNVQTGSISEEDCRPCTVGKYQEGKGAASCDDCPVGKYSGQVKAATAKSCVACEPGTFTSKTGGYSQGQCQFCPAKKQILVPNSSTACPWNFEIDVGDTAEDCKCSEQTNGKQYFEPTDGVCEDCPTNMRCPGDNFTFPDYGFWRKYQTGPHRNNVFPCKPSRACLAPNETECSHDRCAAGFDGASLACAGCDQNHTKVMRTGECQACLGPKYGAVFLVLAGILLVLGYIYRKAGQAIDRNPGQDVSAYNMGTFTIIVNFSAVISVIDIKGGPISKYVVGFFNFDASEAVVYLCLRSYVLQYILMLMVPVICILALAITARLHFACCLRLTSHQKQRRLSVAMSETNGVPGSEENEDGERVETPWVPRLAQACVFVVLYSCTSMANLTISAFVCRDYIPGMTLLTANPAIQCWANGEHRTMIAWASPFFLMFVVVGPLLIAGRMFDWRCTSSLKTWVRLDFLQASYKNNQTGASAKMFKEVCQTNFEMILLVRRICLTVVSLASASYCNQESGPVCVAMVVPINIILFMSMLIQARLMPFRNCVHNYLEIFSLALNFVLFDIALLAADSDENNTNTLSLVLDIVRVTAFLVLGGYGVYENCQSTEVEEKDNSGDDGDYSALDSFWHDT